MYGEHGFGRRRQAQGHADRHTQQGAEGETDDDLESGDQGMFEQAAALPHQHAFFGHAAERRHDELGHAEQARAPLPEQQEQQEQGKAAEHGGVEVFIRRLPWLPGLHLAAVWVSMN